MRIIAQSRLVLLCLTLAIGQANAQTTYQWNGGSDLTTTNWGTTANWAAPGVAPTNGSYNVRLNVNNTTKSPLAYTAAQGTTIYTNGGRGLVIGNGSSGTMTIAGGTLQTLNAGQDVVGNGSGYTGRLIIAGGSYIGNANGLGLGIGFGPHCFLTLNGGSATVTTLAVNSTDSTIDLNGGILNYKALSVTGTGKYTNNFNGGTLQAGTNSSAFLNSFTVANVRTGGAVIDTTNFNITIAQPLLHSTISGDAALDGGLTKKGNGTLTLSAVATYTGPTVVNGGGLVEPFPQTSSGLTLASGTTFNPTLTNSPWFMASAAITNAYLGFNYGSWPVNSYTNTVYYVTNLAVSGSVTCNISGTGFPVTNLTLLTYGSKSGGGSFVVGTLPTGAAANIIDTGSSIVLQITSASIQNLVWSGGDGIWQTNGGLDWNSGTATYLEYPSGISDLVTFNDTSSGTVSINSQVKPTSTTVSVNSSSYNFTGTGHIGGTNGIAMTGTGTLTVGTSNNFSGSVTISGGSGTSGGFLYVNNSSALGDTNGTTTVNGPANTLEIGTAGGAGVGVTNETVTITGTGVGGAHGALRGAATASGANVWAGPVIIGANLSRIGTEDSGNLTVAGPVSDNGLGYSVLLRPGASGNLTMAATGSSCGSTIIYNNGASIVLGANNGISTNLLQMELGNFDVNGFNQTVSGVGDYTYSGATILNNGASPATLTINTGTNSFTSSSSFTDGTGQLVVVKQGSGSQTLSSGTLTYSGNTTVSQGQLIIPSATSMASSITVQGGATLSGQITTSGALTLNANSILVANPAVSPTYSVASLNATAAPLNVSFSSAPTPGVDVLILTASGGITGSAANFQAYGVRDGTFSLQNGNTELHFVAFTNTTTITWAGNNPVHPTFWDVTTTTNWNNAGNPDMFYTYDSVVFDDTGATANVVIQGAALTPGGVTFSNTVNAYTLSGGAIQGTFNLVKYGTNALTLNASNNYSGSTIINGGIVFYAADNRLGTAPVTPTSSNIVLNSGALTMTARNLALNANRGIYLTAAGGTLGNTSGGNFSPSFLEGPGQLTVNCAVGGANFLMGQQNTFAGGMQITGNSGAFVYPIVSSVGDPGGLTSGPWGTGPVVFNGPGTRSTTAGATTVGNAITFAADVPFQTVASEKTLTFSGPITLSGGDRTLNVAIGTTVTTESLVISGPIGQASTGLGLIKSGGGRLILSGTNTYTGNTTVSGGNLVIASTGSLTNSQVVSVNSPGNLDVSAAPFILLAGQTLQGNGAVIGDTTANGSLIPGGAGAVGTLTFSNSLIIAGNVFVELNKSLAQSNDFINVAGTLTNAGAGTLTVTNIGTNALVVGDYFQLFNQPLANGGALAIAGPAGTTFTNNLAVDGSISVLMVASPTPPTLNFTNLGGNQLQFSWTGSGKLQSQTNNLSTGLSTNWGDYPGGATPPVTVTVDPTQGSVFFRVKQ